jgi:hypothetical protein
LLAAANDFWRPFDFVDFKVLAISRGATFKIGFWGLAQCQSIVMHFSPVKTTGLSINQAITPADGFSKPDECCSWTSLPVAARTPACFEAAYTITGISHAEAILDVGLSLFRPTLESSA